MAEPSTIARPYAEAAFRLADAQGKLADWSATLANLSAIAADERVRVAIGDPNFPAAKVAGLFISVLTGKLTGEGENFVRVLAENGRLEVLAEIRAQYTVGYQSTNPSTDGAWRRVEIKIARKNAGDYRVRSRKGYYAPYKK